MKKHTFILSDQTVNCYMFIVLTSGIILDFFRKNPVMLMNHNPNVILGNWENIRVEGTQLLADAVFDEDDTEAMKMFKKVEKGMLNCVSIGFQILEVQYGITGFEDTPVVIKCSLQEASLTPTPANEGALRLYDKDGVLLSSDQVTTLLSKNPTNDNMKKLTFFIAALAAANVTLAADATEDDVLKAVQKLATDNAALTAANELLTTEKTNLTGEITTLKKKETDSQETQITDLVEGAFKAGKLTADKKDQYTKLAKLDFATTKSLIDGLPVHKSLSSQLGAGAGVAGTGGGKYENWGLKQLSKEAPTELARIRAEEPERFKELVKENR